MNGGQQPVSEAFQPGQYEYANQYDEQYDTTEYEQNTQQYDTRYRNQYNGQNVQQYNDQFAQQESDNVFNDYENQKEIQSGTSYDVNQYEIQGLATLVGEMDHINENLTSIPPEQYEQQYENQYQPQNVKVVQFDETRNQYFSTQELQYAQVDEFGNQAQSFLEESGNQTLASYYEQEFGIQNSQIDQGEEGVAYQGYKIQNAQESQSSVFVIPEESQEMTGIQTFGSLELQYSSLNENHVGQLTSNPQHDQSALVDKFDEDKLISQDEVPLIQEEIGLSLSNSQILDVNNNQKELIPQLYLSKSFTSSSNAYILELRENLKESNEQNDMRVIQNSEILMKFISSEKKLNASNDEIYKLNMELSQIKIDIAQSEVFGNVKKNVIY